MRQFVTVCTGILGVILTSCGSTAPAAQPEATAPRSLYREEEWKIPYPGQKDRDVFAFLPNQGEIQGLVVSQDGQTRYFLQVQEALEAQTSAGRIPPVAVLSVIMGERLQEYGLQDGEKSLPTDDRRGGVMGTQAHEYETWMAQVLVPEAEKRLGKKFAPAQRLVVGSSLGGLCAFSSAWNLPQVFGGAGVLSPSFWVRQKDPPDPAGETRQGIRLILQKQPAPLPRLFLTAGVSEGLLATDTQATVEVLKLYYQKAKTPENLVFHLLEDGEHNNDTWSRIFPQILSWYFGKGAPAP